MPLTGPRTGGRPGTLRVAVARFLFVALTSLPAWIAGRAAISSGPSKNPYFLEGDGPLPWLSVVRLLGEVGPAWLAGLGVAVVAALFVDQLLLAGAVRVLSPRRGPWDRPRLAPSVFRDGLAHLWPLARTSVLALAASAAGILLLQLCARRLRLAGTRAGWWSYTLDVRIPAATALAILAWLGLVAAWSFWTRIVVVADRRRRARRAGAIALAVFRRRPGRALVVTAAGLLVAVLLPALVLAVWRAGEPISRTGVALFTFGSLLAMLGQAWIWTLLVRSAVTAYGSAGTEHLRQVPDAPFGFLRRLTTRRGRALPAPARPRGGEAPPRA